MKKILIFALPILLALNLGAQTNEPAVRLALITETGEAAAVSDVLTARLSGNPRLYLLERNEIEKVYREQALSAGNKDYLKLGRILGADGLLLFDIVRTKQATNLTARLIAVKPGVILTDGSFPWPLKDIPSWAESVTTYLNSFLPKLSVLVKDAIPISVVNLRSAVQSADAQETERQLKLLTIQRLSQERQFFVLERQRMQLLSEEKELKADESAFWNGSYLLEGVVDQNGYSQDVITINARLTPPKGSAPLLMEVSGSRTNNAEVINRLAAKVTELLKVNSGVKEWNTTDEAAQYFEEAKWALRWRVFSEAQAAADSAWALGKHDMDCATVQVEAYEIPSDAIGYQGSEYTNPSSTNQVVQTAMEDAAPNRPWGLTWKEQNWGGVKVVQYVSTGKFPDAKNIDRAAHALQLYYAFSRTLPPDEPKADSPWYRLGVEDLTSASRVLQHFNFVPESQRTVGDKLAELRALSRSVAEWISRSPSVHDSYFVGDRIGGQVGVDQRGHLGAETAHGLVFRFKVEDRDGENVIGCRADGCAGGQQQGQD
jgi:curli biogenesis system outer membrane secretion channel CsgG